MERSIEDEFEELAAHHRLVTEFHNCASEWFNAIQNEIQHERQLAQLLASCSANDEFGACMKQAGDVIRAVAGFQSSVKHCLQNYLVMPLSQFLNTKIKEAVDMKRKLERETEELTVVKEKVQQISNKGRVMYKKLLEAEEEQRNLQASCDSLTREARAMAAVVNVQTKQNCTNALSYLVEHNREYMERAIQAFKVFQPRIRKVQHACADALMLTLERTFDYTAISPKSSTSPTSSAQLTPTNSTSSAAVAANLSTSPTGPAPTAPSSTFVRPLPMRREGSSVTIGTERAVDSAPEAASDEDSDDEADDPAGPGGSSSSARAAAKGWVSSRKISEQEMQSVRAKFRDAPRGDLASSAAATVPGGASMTASSPPTSSPVNSSSDWLASSPSSLMQSAPVLPTSSSSSALNSSGELDGEAAYAAGQTGPMSPPAASLRNRMVGRAVRSSSSLITTKPVARALQVTASAVGYASGVLSSSLHGTTLFPFEQSSCDGSYVFECQRIYTKIAKQPISRVFVVHLANATIMTYEFKSSSVKERDAGKLVCVKRSNVNNHKLKLFWTFRNAPEKLLFPSLYSRERFYEVVWAAKHIAAGLATFVPNSPRCPIMRTGLPQKEELSVWVGTWNLGNAAPPSSLHPWISSTTKYDLYAVSVQECEYETQGTTSEASWFDAVRQAVGEGYVTVAAVSLLVMRMLVLVRREHYHKITNIKRDTVPTGMANVIGNKGAVVVSLSVNETHLCFIGCHLAPHMEQCANRNQHYREIVSRANTRWRSFDVTNSHHHLFWCGDLNYRVEMQRSIVLDVLQQPEADEYWDLVQMLQALDQLPNEQAANNAFVGFQEGVITFRPTYRFNRNEVNDRGYRTFSAEKMRVPAWCDRVLWKSLPGSNNGITQTAYDSCDVIMTSDHSPVFATFLVESYLPSLPYEPVPTIIRLASVEFKSKQQRKGAKCEYVLHFFCPCVESPLDTGVALRKNDNGDPIWDDSQVPDLVPATTSREYLEAQHIGVILRDKEGNDVGQGSIPLDLACDGLGRFNSMMTFKGIESGRLTGTVQVLFEPKATDGYLIRGFLVKQGGARKTWKRRWFRLDAHGTLSYYGSQTDEKPLKSINMSKTPVKDAAALTGKAYCLAVVTASRIFYLSAETKEELDAWYQRLSLFSS